MIYHSSEINEVLDNFQVNKDVGLFPDDANYRFAQYGANIPKKSRRTSFSKIANTYIKNSCNILLLISAAISLTVNLVYETPFPYLPLVMVFMLVLNIALNIGLKIHSENIKNTLEGVNIPKVRVLRNGAVQYINSAYVVPGDILILESGDYICADARLVESQDFRCDESFVTNEPITAEKNHLDISEDITPIEQRSNMVFCGSNVITGHAKAVVTETGTNTEIGKANKLLKVINTKDSREKEKIASICRTSSVILAVFFVITFLTNVIINFNKNIDFAITLSESFINSAVMLICALPIALTAFSALSLLLCAKSLYTKGILIKNLSAVDTLPEVSVICADKSGVLTKDNMMVQKVFNGSEIFDIHSVSADKQSMAVLRLASLCTSQSTADIDSPMYNDATELAILRSYTSMVPAEERDVYVNFPLLSKIPFSSEHKVTLTVNMIDSAPCAIIKGAPDFLLKACGCEENKVITDTVNSFAKSGMRVIAVAYRRLSEIPSNPELSDYETDMTFAGIIALSYSPQMESSALIKKCKARGLKTVMITGDHLETARAVAFSLGIMTDDSQIISGDELEKITDDELVERINNYTVFARLLPDQKARIVNAFKAAGETVAITGDSVNDALALDAADIGIAMGTNGTDVARGVADVILNDNRFASIITAIKAAKGYFGGIRKVISFLISSNLGKLLAILLCLLIHKVFPFNPIQFLMIILIADYFPAISIITDSIEEKRISLKQDTTVKQLTNKFSLILITVQTVITCTVGVIAYSAFNNDSTMMFATIIFAQLFNMATVKFDKFFYKSAHFCSVNNTIILVLLILATILFSTTSLGSQLGFAVITFSQLLIALLISSAVLVSGELTKLGYMLYKNSKKQ